MANMTFLALFDGDGNYEDSGAGGTLVGTPNAYQAGHWAGKNGAFINANVAEDFELPYAAALGVADSKTSGEILIRFRYDTRAAISYYVALGSVASGSQLVGLRTNSAGTQLQGAYFAGLANPYLQDLGAISNGVSHVARIWWDGVNLGAALDSGTPLTGTRTVPTVEFGEADSKGLFVGSSAGTANPPKGLIDAVALFDGKLSDAEYAIYRTAAVPWSFDMHNSDPPVVDAGPDAGVVVFTEWTQAGSFTDPDSPSWTATVDYDDGDGPEALSLDGTTFALAYTWTTVGTKTVTVTVTDSVGTVGTDTVTVEVVAGLLTGTFVVSSVEGQHETAPVIDLGG